jgi:hypothetical protein
MFRKITSNRDPRDTLLSELKKEFAPHLTKLRGTLLKLTQKYRQFLFVMMVINIVLSIFLVTTVFKRQPPPAKHIIVATPNGLDQILIAGEKLKKTIALNRKIDSLSSIKKLSSRDSILLDSALDQFQKLKP